MPVKGQADLSFAKPLVKRRTRLMVACGTVVAGLFHAGITSADTWNIAGTGDWNTASNWSTGLPGTGDAADIENGGTATISASPASGVAEVWAGNGAGSGNLSMSAGTLTVGTRFEVGYLAGAPANANITGSFTMTGGTVTGAFNADIGWKYNNSAQSAATVTLSGTSQFNQTGSSSYFYLGQDTSGNAATNTGGSGTFTQNDSSQVNFGSAATHANYFAVGGVTTGTYTLNNNSVLNVYSGGGGVAAGFEVGDQISSHGTLNVNDNATVNVGDLYVGKFRNAVGVVNQNGGTVNVGMGTDTAVAESRIGGATSADGAAHGTYNMNGGTLNIAPNFQVGAYGTGNFTQSGGVVNSNQYFSIGRFSGNGTVEINGGQFNQTSASFLFLVGESGTGLFDLNGGTLNCIGGIELALNSSSNGTMKLTDYSGSSAILTTPVVKKGQGTGNITLDGGTLRASASSTTFFEGMNNALVGFDGAIFDSNGFNVTINQSLVSEGTDGGITKKGLGTVTLTASNALNGPITVNNGILVANQDASLGVGGTTLQLNGGMLGIPDDTAVTGNSVSWAGGGLQLDNYSSALSFDSNPQLILGAIGASILSGTITGATTNLTYVGPGQLNLTNAGNTYSGTTLISGGVLNFVAGSLGTGSVTLSGNATLQYATGNTVDMTSGRTFTLGSGGGQIDTNGNNVSYSGSLLGGVAGASFTKLGAGTLTLNGASTYTGETLVSGGTLVANGSSLGSTSSNLDIAPASSITASLNVQAGVVNAATLKIAGNDANTDGGTGTLNQTAGTINTAAYFVVGQANAAVATYNLSGTGILNQNTVGSGNLEIGVFGSSSGTVNMSGTTQINLQNNADIRMGSSTTSGNGTFNQSAGTVTFYSNGGTTIGGTGRLVMGNAGTGNYTYNLNGGTLIVPQIVRNTGTANFNFNGGVLQAASTGVTLLASGITSTVKSGGANINTNGNSVTVNQPLVHDAALGATLDGGLIKQGAGTLTLNFANTYTGATIVKGGTLKLGFTAGLYEGEVANGTNGFDLTDPIPSTSVQTSLRYGTSTNNTTSGSLQWTNNTTWGYTGYLNIPSAATYTFGKEFDDGGYVKIDGTQVLSDDVFGNQTKASVALTAGLHLVDIRFGQSTGGVGPNPGYVAGQGIAYSTNGGTTWSTISDPGNGSVLRIAGSLASTSPLQVANGATFDLNGNNQSAPTLTDVTGITGGGTVTNNGASASTLTLSPTSTTSFSGGINNGSSTVALTLAGSSTMTLSGNNTYTGATSLNSGTLTVTGSIGSLAITAAVGSTFNANGATNGGLANTTALTANGTVRFAGTPLVTGPSLIQIGSLTLGSSGAVTVADPGSTHHANRSVLLTSGLTFPGSTNTWTGSLDLAGNDMIVHGGSITNVTNQVKKGYNLGGFNSTGITSSTARSNATHLTTLGVLFNNNGSGATLLNSFDNQSVGLTDVLVKYTYYGDANLDGSVNSSDYSQIDNGFNSGLSGWYNGDFNYDGIVNSSDYSLIDNAFNSTQGSSLSEGSPASLIASNTSLIASSSALIASSAAQISGGATAVPEPGSLSLLAIGAAGLLRRRRRDR